MFRHPRNTKHNRGIMLVEMLVAFGIVSVTFVVIVSAYLQSSRATQIAQRQAEVADALSYALADMAREAQLGTDYSVPGLASFEFSRVDSATGLPLDTVSYSLSAGPAVLEKTVGAAAPAPLTPPDVMVLNMFVRESAHPLIQNRVQVEITAKHRVDENDERVPETVVQAHFYERSY